MTPRPQADRRRGGYAVPTRRAVRRRTVLLTVALLVVVAAAWWWRPASAQEPAGEATAAVEAPRFYTRHLVNTFYSKAFHPGVVEVENRIPQEARNTLSSRGHKVETKESWAVSTSPTVVRILPNGVLEAAADVRQYRYALSW